MRPWLAAVAMLAAAGSSLGAQAPSPPSPPPGMQWLYGSGEGGAASIQAYRVFRDYVLARARARPRQSVVLAEGSSIPDFRFAPCGRRPLAVILDVDETALLNVGFEYDDAVHPGRTYDQERWNRWERTGASKVWAVPGAAEALRAIRTAGVTVIFNSNRMAATAAQTEAALNGVALGPAVHGRTLWLQGDVAPGSAKDPRRAAISRHYCVIAMAGDQLGDFTDLLNARYLDPLNRRILVTEGRLSTLWGAGWFVLSNPVYGSGLRGTIEDIFPPAMRWSDPQGGQN
jgi:5'-nucleotidase (lipoprotein e(P4) family)